MTVVCTEYVESPMSQLITTIAASVALLAQENPTFYTSLSREEDLTIAFAQVSAYQSTQISSQTP